MINHSRKPVKGKIMGSPLGSRLGLEVDQVMDCIHSHHRSLIMTGLSSQNEDRKQIRISSLGDFTVHLIKYVLDYTTTCLDNNRTRNNWSVAVILPTKVCLLKHWSSTITHFLSCISPCIPCGTGMIGIDTKEEMRPKISGMGPWIYPTLLPLNALLESGAYWLFWWGFNVLVGMKAQVGMRDRSNCM